VFGFSKCYLRTRNKQVSKNSVAPCQSPAPCERVVHQARGGCHCPPGLYKPWLAPFALISTASQLSSFQRGQPRWRIPRGGPRLSLPRPSAYVMQTDGGLGRPGHSVWGKWLRAQVWSQTDQSVTLHTTLTCCDLSYATSLLRELSPCP